MSTEKTEGIVIRQADFSETSRVVTWFTRDWGKISAIAKGARRLKGPFESAIDLLARCRIVFIRKSSASLDILTEAQLLSRFRPQSRQLVSLYGGYYVAELLSSLTEDYDPHPILYDEAVEVLERLEQDVEPKLALVRFELMVLREIGQLPQLTECVACGRPVEEKTRYGFWVSQGGLICQACQQEDYRKAAVPSGTVAVLRRLSTAPADAARRVAVSAAQLGEMRTIMNSAIAYALGRRPKTFRYIQ